MRLSCECRQCIDNPYPQIEVNGPNTHPVFKFLKDHTPLGHGGGADVDWNFAKWVVNKKGYPVVRYPSAMDMSALRGWLEYELSRN
jgi:glutathione peroxidase